MGRRAPDSTFGAEPARIGAGEVGKPGLEITLLARDYSLSRRVRLLAQYTARPPEMSKVAPVEKEQSSLESHDTIAAISCTSTKRFIGIFESM